MRMILSQPQILYLVKLMENWLPIGFSLSESRKLKKTIQEGNGWQIIEVTGGQGLLVNSSIHEKWIELRLIDSNTFKPIEFGQDNYHFFFCEIEYTLTEIEYGKSPRTKNDAIAFAQSLRESRKICKEVSFRDSIYLESISRLLPTFTLTNPIPDDVILGYWLTGGLSISVNSFRKLKQVITWLNDEDLIQVINNAYIFDGESLNNGIKAFDTKVHRNAITVMENLVSKQTIEAKENFLLAGRLELTKFFNDHIIDIIKNENRYKLLGIDFPSAVILFGPPGSGKTFAVEKLTDFLGWPMYSIDASSIGSPYIHETSKKIAALFDKAIDNAPSVLVIDEMDAFLSNRDNDFGQHRIEEVAEFLRIIPKAVENKVLIIGMTNRIDVIDPAILRRGRFDHLIKVDFASSEEIFDMMFASLEKIPKEDGIKLDYISEKLQGRPLSDASFLIREAARLAAKSGKDYVDQESLNLAFQEITAVDDKVKLPNKIGFL